MKKILALILAFTATSAFADVSGGVTLASDYFFRGVSQTQGESAVQWNLEAEKNGVYGGTWGSTVDFGGEASIEYDFYGGYRWQNDAVGVDVGIIQYNYNNQIDSVEEMYGVLSYKIFSVGYWRDRDNSDLDYKQVEVALPWVDFADVSVRYGEFGNDARYGQVTVSKELKNGFNLTLEVIDDVDEAVLHKTSEVALSLGYSF